MGHKKLVFIAPAWRETLDTKTGTRYLRAAPSSSGTCEVVATPIPGTDPVEYMYSCDRLDCLDDCDLRKRKLPGGGTLYECICVASPGSRPSASTRGKAGRKPAKVRSKQGKAAGKKKPRR
ncbi:MAG: hypothetical protein ICCCNLDF_01279 [Planctomycetes bacterium]|nr:hypothetical protein [Planctomycetota bacterium]